MNQNPLQIVEDFFQRFRKGSISFLKEAMKIKRQV